MISSDSQKELHDKVTHILHKKFNDYQKQQIKVSFDSFRFACPYCGDSKTKLSAKRGNLYLDTGYYFCFNCGVRQTAINFFKRFSQDISIDSFSEIKRANNEQIKKSLKDYNTDIIAIQKLAVDKSLIMKKLGLQPCYKEHPFVQERLLMHRIDNLAFKGKDIYIFNLLGEDKVLGFQIKKFFGNNSQYHKYNLSKIYSDILKDDSKESELREVDKISLIYNFFDVDFSKPTTIFEGPIDSWFMRNSIGASSVNVNVDFLNDCQQSRFFYDNDAIGKRKMIEKLEVGKTVFAWELFLDEFNIDVYLKDMNDIARFFNKKHMIHHLTNLDKFFTSDIYDSIFI